MPGLVGVLLPRLPMPVADESVIQASKVGVQPVLHHAPSMA